MTRICDPIPIGTTKRQGSSPSKKEAMLDRQKGKCALCGRGMVPGEKLIDEHLRALGLGGGNEPENRALVHAECAYEKTHGKDGDAARITKARAQKRAIYGFVAPRREMQSRGFAPTEPKPSPTRSPDKLAGLPKPSLYASQEGSRP